MYVILGGTGHIGSSLVDALLARGEPVTVVTRDAAKATPWAERGAAIAEVDVRDGPALRQVLARGRRAYLLNPPADPSTDTVAEERASAAAIVAALEGSGLELVVAASTYGAQPGDALGDLGVLYELEQALKSQPIPATILRGAYYLSNWDLALETARSEGRLDTLLPADLVLPMVAPRDIGAHAAQLLTGPLEPTRTVCIEGPQRYSPADVARAFAAALGRPVEVATTPPVQWLETLQKLGFSAPSARSMANMTRVTIADGGGVLPSPPVHGPTTLEAYVEALVRGADEKPE